MSKPNNPACGCRRGCRARRVRSDPLEDGLLMEVSESQLREALHQLVESLVNPYKR
jgi:hypothetical protein